MRATHLRNGAIIGPLVLTLAGLSGCWTHVIVDPAPPPPTRDDVSGTWIGLYPHRAIRLDLHSDGSARLVIASAYHGGSVREYESKEWHLNEHDLSIDFAANAPDEWPIYFDAHAVRDALRNVSVSISETGGAPIEGPLTRGTTIQRWLDELDFR